MTTLLEQVAEYLLRWSAWLIVLGAVAGSVGAVARLVLRPRLELRTAIVGAVSGAIVVASLADRFGVAGPTFDVWRFPLPWVWAAAGGAAGTLVAALAARRRRALEAA